MAELRVADCAQRAARAIEKQRALTFIHCAARAAPRDARLQRTAEVAHWAGSGNSPRLPQLRTALRAAARARKHDFCIKTLARARRKLFPLRYAVPRGGDSGFEVS